jgi:hypothetical protein
MRRLYTALSVITCTLLILLVAGYLYNRGYRKYYAGQEVQIAEAISGKQDYDIVFVGSSRTHVHVNPRIVDSVTGLSSYNLGIEGGRIIEMSMVARSYLEHHRPPRLMVIDLVANSLDVDKLPFFNPNRYYPFLGDTVIYNSLKPYKPVFVLKYFPAMRITEADDHLKAGTIAGLLGKHEPVTGHTYKGYLENFEDTLPPIRKVTIDSLMPFPISKKATKALDYLVDYCRIKRVQIVFTYAPEYRSYEFTKRAGFFRYVEEKSNSAGIPYLNYRNNPICYDNHLFCNISHLNRHGADVYSAMLASDLKPYLANR